MDDATRNQLIGILLIVGLVFIIIWIVSATTRAKIKKDWGQPAPRGHDPAPSLTVREERDARLGGKPGRYEVIGVDRESKLDTTLVVNADSEANAKVKAELEGIIATQIKRIG